MEQKKKKRERESRLTVKRYDDKYIKNFEVYFEAEAHGSFEYPKKILNYSIFLTLLAFIEIIYTTKFLILIVDNNQMSLNTDIYTIIIQSRLTQDK